MRAPDSRLLPRDLEILRYLLRHSVANLKQVATALDMPEASVAKRVAALQDQNRISRCIQIIDWRAAGFPLRYRVDLMIDHRALVAERIAGVSSLEALGKFVVEESARHFARDIFVYDALIPFGQAHDLSILLRTRNTEVLLAYLTRWLGTLAVVSATSTFQEAWSYQDSSYSL